MAAGTAGCSAVAAQPSEQAFTSGRTADLADASRAITDAARLRDRGRALLQQARETGDPSLLARAQGVFEQLLAIAPHDPDASIGLGSIALSRHAFADALELGRGAEEVAPGSGQPLGIQFDALIELGRYDEARAVLERMLATRPDLGSYARLSYYHELHGRLDEAIEAMEQAVIAGGAAIENTEFARVQLGDLWLLAGDADRATHLYETALKAIPGSVPPLRGLARVAVGRGDLEAAIRHLEAASARSPLPDVLIALGEAQQAAGDREEAAASYRLVAQIEDLYRAAGVVAEPAVALFEVDHGDASLALELAEAAYRTTPSVRAADALGWALHATGRTDEALARARQAVAFGTLEPSFHYHLGVIAASRGLRDEAAQAIRTSLQPGTGWSALHAPRALSLLESLS